MKKVGILLLFVGLLIVLWSGYSFWDQSKAVTHEPEVVQKNHPGWESTVEKKTIAVEEEESKSTYEYGEKAAMLSIPRIGSTYSVYYGTDEDSLKKGVGLHESKWTVTPDENGHVVLSGHRDTVFHNLDQVEEGDHLYVEFNGTVYDYQVRKIWITDEDDRSVIVNKDEPTLTLTTCYPFDYIGFAPERYIIQSELVSKETPLRK
ncbi:class D sortase [Alkalihalobacillus sp. CinArs1]|uniref:class D sortase n=1 Tax=Alkalihalobacillus sp. CinArs1 TaxID=2995314 RepID=UPI0022DDB188|nr:class D sortase [Alkalihalobacillus sp. CinArs1]